MTYKTTGTLKEIGANVGDVVARDGGKTFEVDQWKLEYWAHPDCRIISRATHSPVRAVTRKEIVPGVYGIIKLATVDVPEGQVWIGASSVCTREELTAAIATLTEIRDAL